MDPVSTTDAEFNAMWNRLVFGGDIWYQSVVTTSRFEKGRLAEIRLTPVDLGYTARGADRGVPRLASPEVGGRSSSGCSGCRNRSARGSPSKAASASSSCRHSPPPPRDDL